MTYRVRKQGVTGKLILQAPIGGEWFDVRDATAAEPGIPFEIVHLDTLEKMLADAKLLRARVDKYERRSKGQRDAADRRKAAALESEGATPLAPQSAAQE